jgi:hypothetical protein
LSSIHFLDHEGGNDKNQPEINIDQTEAKNKNQPEANNKDQTIVSIICFSGFIEAYVSSQIGGR